MRKDNKPETLTKHDFIFSNLFKCKKCGCFLVGEIKKQKYIYYHCTGNKGGNCKKSSYVREDVLEKAVLDVLGQFKINNEAIEVTKKALKTEINNQTGYSEYRIEQTNKKLNKQKKNK
jgi:hypothetical protein